MKKLLFFIALFSFYASLLKAMECKDRVPQDYYNDMYNNYKNLINERDAYIQAKIQEGATTIEATRQYHNQLSKLSHNLAKLRNCIEK